MSAGNSFAAFTGRAELGDGFVVQFAFTGTSMKCDWSPRVPSGWQARRLIPAYLRARRSFVDEIAGKLGIRVMIVSVSLEDTQRVA